MNKSSLICGSPLLDNVFSFQSQAQNPPSAPLGHLKTISDTISVHLFIHVIATCSKLQSPSGRDLDPSIFEVLFFCQRIAVLLTGQTLVIKYSLNFRTQR